MQSYPLDFRGARIISGMEEGAYGWITINYLLEGFAKVRDSLSQIHHLFYLNDHDICMNPQMQTVSLQNSIHLMVNGCILKLGIF